MVLLVAMFAVFAILTYIPGSRLGYLNIWGQGDLLDHLFTALSVKPSLFTRYLRYIYNVFTTFHFASMARHHDLSATVLQRTRFTLLLTFSGFIFIVIFGISAGAYAAYKKGSLFDKAVSLLSMFVASLPPFCLAIYLAMIFCLGLHLLPVFGYDSIKNFILPTITIASASVHKEPAFPRSEGRRHLIQTCPEKCRLADNIGYQGKDCIDLCVDLHCRMVLCHSGYRILSDSGN